MTKQQDDVAYSLIGELRDGIEYPPDYPRYQTAQVAASLVDLIRSVVREEIAILPSTTDIASATILKLEDMLAAEREKTAVIAAAIIREEVRESAMRQKR